MSQPTSLRSHLTAYEMRRVPTTRTSLRGGGAPLVAIRISSDARHARPGSVAACHSAPARGPSRTELRRERFTSASPSVPNMQKTGCRLGIRLNPLTSCEHLLLLFAYTASMSRYDRPSHQVYCYFFKRGGWQVQFLEADPKTPLPRKLTFTDPKKLGNWPGAGERGETRIAGKCWSTHPDR